MAKHHGDHHSGHHSDHHHSGHHHSAHHAAVAPVSTSVDDGDTTVDNSVNQAVHTDSGDFTQVIDTESSGAFGSGAVSAGGDITGSAVTSGDGNQVGTDNVAGSHNLVGDGNQVASGNDATTSFGSGAATSAHIDGAVVGAGGALSIGGPADGSQVVVDSHDHITTDTTTTTVLDNVGNVHADAVTDSGNTTTTTATLDSHDQLQVDLLSYNDLDIDLSDLLGGILIP